jgi:hypothetical protein
MIDKMIFIGFGYLPRMYSFCRKLCEMEEISVETASLGDEAWARHDHEFDFDSNSSRTKQLAADYADERGSKTTMQEPDGSGRIVEESDPRYVNAAFDPRSSA